MTNEAQVEPGQPVDRGVSSGEPGDRARREERMRNLAELVATVLLAMATVLTAWSAFEANKWSGTQAIQLPRRAPSGPIRRRRHRPPTRKKSLTWTRS